MVKSFYVVRDLKYKKGIRWLKKLNFWKRRRKMEFIVFDRGTVSFFKMFVMLKRDWRSGIKCKMLKYEFIFIGEEEEEMSGGGLFEFVGLWEDFGV